MKSHNKKNIGTMSNQKLSEKGQDSQTFLVYDNNTGKTSRLVRLISVASVDILPFLGHRDLDLPYSVCLEVYLLDFWSILLKIERDL